MNGKSVQQDLRAEFVTTHYVDETYHKSHPQLIHRHAEEVELLYVIEGSGSYSVAGREYLLQRGNLAICNANIFHGEPPFHGHQMTSHCCVIRGLQMKGVPANTVEGSLHAPVLYFEKDRNLVEHLYLALYEASQKNKMDPAVCDLLANAILEVVLQKLRERNVVNDQVHQKNDQFVAGIMDYLDRHFMENPNLQELEDVFRISRFNLSRIFKAETGLSPMKYVLHRKIGESQNLLMNTEMPIGDIGEYLGFNNNCHYSSCFKKYVGITPSQYRSHFKEQTKPEN